MANRVLNDPSAGNNAATHVAQARPDAGDVDVWVAGWQRTGVLSGCVVTATGSDMDVDVAAGTVAIGDIATTVAGDSLTLATGGPRVDLVVVDSLGAVSVVQGSAASRPAWPTIPPLTAVLAMVYVPTDATTISNAEIVDKRVLLAPKGLRLLASMTTASLASNTYEMSTIGLATGFRLLRITTSRPARVRLYDRAAKQTADAGRQLGANPGLDSGLILEYVTTTETLSSTLSPTVDGYSLEASPTAEIPTTVTNLGTTGTVTVDFVYTVTE